MQGLPSDYKIRSVHPFTRPGIRLWLPLIMLVMIAVCGWLITPRVRVLEFIVLLFLVYVAISALVSVGEIAVTDDGLIIDRLLLRPRFVPWETIFRVQVYAHTSEDTDTHIEFTTLSVFEGLSILNRLPGLVYGQGFRQTMILTPDAIQDYDVLLTALEEHCTVEWQRPTR